MGITRGAKFQVSNRGTAAYPLLCFRSQISNPFSIFYEGKPIKLSFNVILVALIVNVLISRTCQILLKPLRQPKLVSELIGGIMLGPSLLSQSPRFVSMVFPPTSEFVMKNLGIMGFMLFLFLCGVKMDMGLLKRSGKKQICVALSGVFVPVIIVTVVGTCTRKSMDSKLARIASFGAISSSLSVTTFPIQYIVLQELNLLSSDVGNMALSTALISDAIGVNFMSVFEALKQSEVSVQSAVWYYLSTLVVIGFLLTAARQAMLWIIRNTPEGQPVDQFYVIAIFLAVFGFGFLTDMLGLAVCNGSFWLGLVIPDGPPLGAALVEKCETIIMEVFLPCSFAFIGFCTDFEVMKEAGWSALSPLFGMIISGYLSKFISTLLPAKMVGLSWRESFAVSLVLSMRGHVDLILYYHWVDKNVG
ncbi:hypothetical protein V6N13_070012 [Hibiscus sabdariffa]